MSAPRPSAVAIKDGEITIDAELLASGLGLSTEALRAEMRRSLVYGAVEKGVGEDQGRLRLSLRYRARSWTVVIEPGEYTPARRVSGQTRRARRGRSGPTCIAKPIIDELGVETTLTRKA